LVFEKVPAGRNAAVAVTSLTYMYMFEVLLNNASDYRANGLLSDYIAWTNGITGY